jgi:UDP-glucose 4-epimerase
VVDLAREAGHETVGLDLQPDEGGRTDLVGNIGDAALCRRAVEGCQSVVHCAAQVSVQQSQEDPAADAKTNVIGTVNLLESVSDVALDGRFVNVSSAAVYGEPVDLPIPEDHPTLPRSPYGQSKLAAEGYADLYRQAANLAIVTVRPFNVYSARQDPTNPYSGVISIFADRISEGKPPIVHGDGAQTRDFVHAEDVARWIVDLATRREETAFDRVNLGTGWATSVLELATTMTELADGNLEPAFGERRRGDIDDSRADVTRRRKLGLEATIDIEEGLAGLLA